MSGEIRVSEDPAAEVAERLTEVAGAGGHVVLTGGSSPKRAYELAAERDGDWSGATVWFTDERCVPPDDPDSNYGMADRSLLSQLSAGPQVVRMEGELGPDAGSGAYEAEIRERVGGEPRWNLLLLGMGPDGHVASLFPGKPELEERSRLAVGVPLAGMAPQVPRISLTHARALLRARGDPADHGREQGRDGRARVRARRRPLAAGRAGRAALRDADRAPRRGRGVAAVSDRFIGLDVGGTKIASATLG